MKVLLEKHCPSIEMSAKCAQKFVNTFLKDTSNFTIFFEGGLGAGKSHLTREMLKHLGIDQTIPSPTYTLVNEYTCPKQKQYAHFDLYRLEEPKDFFARGLIETAEDPEISCFIEWPERLSPESKRAFSGTHFIIKIDHGIGAGMRKIKILSSKN